MLSSVGLLRNELCYTGKLSREKLFNSSWKSLKKLHLEKQFEKKKRVMLQFVLVQSKAWMITWDSVSYFTVLKRLKVRLELVSSKNITSYLAWDYPHHSWGNGNNHQPMPVSQTMFSLPAEVFFFPHYSCTQKSLQHSLHLSTMFWTYGDLTIS